MERGWGVAPSHTDQNQPVQTVWTSRCLLVPYETLNRRVGDFCCRPWARPVQSLEVQAPLEDFILRKEKPWLVRARYKLRSGLEAERMDFSWLVTCARWKFCFLSGVALNRFQRERQQPCQRARKHTREWDKRDGTDNSSSDPNSPDNCLITASSVPASFVVRLMCHFVIFRMMWQQFSSRGRLCFSRNPSCSNAAFRRTSCTKTGLTGLRSCTGDRIWKAAGFNVFHFVQREAADRYVPSWAQAAVNKQR